MDMAVNAERRQRARRERGQRSDMAALDLGTNNCRLLIARPEARELGAQEFDVVDAFSRIVRLGEGMSGSPGPSRLGDAAMGRSIRALRVCASKIRRSRAARVRCVATEACRRAANGNAFVERVKEQTGLDLEIISCEEEARLAVSGCAPLLDRNARRALIVDIGGGSTELIWVRLDGGRRHEVIASCSLDCGVVSLAERHGGDRIDEDVYQAMVRQVREKMTEFEAGNGIRAEVDAGGVQIVGTSGTVTTLAAIHLGLRRYDRARVDGTDLGYDAVAAVGRRIRGLDFQGRAANPCIGRERADLVVAGCAILDAVCALFPAGEIRVADRGVREGILYALMADAAGAAGPSR